MDDTGRRVYSAADLKPFQSAYLHGGKAQEIWNVSQLVIEGNQVNATLNIENPFRSPTDEDGFHLSVYTAQEFCSEIIMVYAYTRLGLLFKAEEVWMTECHSRFRRSIRTSEGIAVEMREKSFRFIQGTAFCHGVFRVTDAMDGLFEIDQKGFFRVQRPERNKP